MSTAAKIDVYKEWLGIPDGPRPPDHYALLRTVQFEDDHEKIRKNYKKLNGHVRKYSTGQYSNESQELLNELARAMLCLTDAERKQEYDRQLGREFDDGAGTGEASSLTGYLLKQGVLTDDQVREVKDYAERAGLTLRDAVVQLKLADQELATRALAAEIGLAYLDLSDMVPDENVLDSVPKSVVRRYTCLPLFVDGERVMVACASEPGHDLEEEFRLRFGLALRPVLATPKSIKEAIDQYYAPGMRKEVATPLKSTGMAAKLADKVSAKKPAAAMSESELEERKNLGIVICCMTFVLLANLDTWVLYDRLYRFVVPWWPSWFPFFSTILIGGPVIFTLFQTHIRKR